MENQALLCWLDNAHSIILENSDRVPSENIVYAELLQTVGRSIFSLSIQSTLHDIVSEISRIYSVDCNVDDLDMIVEYTLVHGVSEQCDLRGDFVQGIMSLEPDVQIYLMQIIEEKMLQNDPIQSPEKVNGHIEVDSHSSHMVDDPSLEGMVPSQQHDIVEQENINYAGVERMKDSIPFNCFECIEKDQQRKKLSNEIENLHAKYQQEVQKLKEEISMNRNKLVDLELLIIERDDLIFQHKNKLLDYDKHQEKLDASNVRINQLEEQLQVLQDDLEVLKPQAIKLDHAEAQLERYRSKLDELNDIKQQLKAESSSHSSTYDKLMVLEQEVEGLRKLKPQLEEYRQQHAESVIAIKELEINLKAKEIEVYDLRVENASLRNNHAEQLHQSIHLQDELRSTAEQLREKDQLNGIGEGMSELNPLLMQELNRLRIENKELMTKIDKSSLQSLEALNKELSDQKCISTSLQKKYMTTKDTLEKAFNDIKTLSMNLTDKIFEVKELRSMLQESSSMFEEEKQILQVVFNNKIAFSHKRSRHQMELVQFGHNEVFRIYHKSLEIAHDQLTSTEKQLHHMTTLQSETSQTLHTCQTDLESMSRERDLMEVEHCEEIVQLKKESSLAIEMKDQQHEDNLRSLHEQHSLALQSERQQVILLEADLEQERMKRRKIERQKKYHEMDAHRQKAQLQANGTNGGFGSNGEGIEEVLTEFKSMQSLLEIAQNEIVVLKSQLSGTYHDHDSNSARLSNSSSNDAVMKGATTTTTNNNNMRSMGGYSCYLEQTEFSDKKIEQLIKEKRDLLSRNLEETKEKNEISQKLLLLEKENTTLRAEIRKIILEKERNERKLFKQIENYSSKTNSTTTTNTFDIYKENMI